MMLGADSAIITGVLSGMSVFNDAGTKIWSSGACAFVVCSAEIEFGGLGLQFTVLACMRANFITHHRVCVCVSVSVSVPVCVFA